MKLTDAILHVLLTYDDRMHIVTREQCEKITAAMNSGNVKTVDIGGVDLIVLSNIRDMPTLETYERQMKHKLQEKGQRMCRRCFNILPRQDQCPCREDPEKYPDYIQLCTEENPPLAQLVQALSDDGVKLLT